MLQDLQQYRTISIRPLTLILWGSTKIVQVVQYQTILNTMYYNCQKYLTSKLSRIVQYVQYQISEITILYNFNKTIDIHFVMKHQNCTSRTISNNIDYNLLQLPKISWRPYCHELYNMYNIKQVTLQYCTISTRPSTLLLWWSTKIVQFVQYQTILITIYYNCQKYLGVELYNMYNIEQVTLQYCTIS